MTPPMDHSHTEHTALFQRKLDFLESDFRKKQTPVHSLLHAAAITSETRVLDLGAGTGYFTFPAASATSAPVYALDLDQQMLGYIKEKAEKSNLQNIHLLQQPADTTTLDDSSIDLIIASLMLHEVPSLTNVLAEAHRVLAPGGKLLIIEYEEDALDGPPEQLRIGSEKLRQILAKYSFEITKNISLDNSVYTCIAQKKE
ncbi:MAG: class I SAM-dependent methyltransferase [Enterococcus sp.]